MKASEATVVIAGATSRLSRALPGVAQRVDGRITTHVTGAEVDGGQLSIERWYYRQRMKATLTSPRRPWFVIFAPGIYGPAPASDEAVTCRAIGVPAAGPWRTRVIGEDAGSSEGQTIRPDATLLFVAGAGWTKKQGDGASHVPEAAELIRGFLDRSQASLGSSKSLVDQSSEGGDVIPFMTHLNQVGQTGATPRHPKGLSTCCHGEEPHVVGWRFVTERRAVNLDANCGWARGKADVVYVADAFEVMKRVNELLG
ncbi:MAG: electron transfer flavoprotein subunit alpha [Candidatus Eisenbacteria bacterium]